MGVSIQDLSGCTNLIHFTGFMLDYDEIKWNDWFSSYCQRSKMRYSVLTGKQVNKLRQDHGIIHIHYQNFTFKSFIGR